MKRVLDLPKKKMQSRNKIFFPCLNDFFQQQNIWGDTALPASQPPTRKFFLNEQIFKGKYVVPIPPESRAQHPVLWQPVRTK